MALVYTFLACYLCQGDYCSAKACEKRCELLYKLWSVCCGLLWVFGVGCFKKLHCNLVFSEHTAYIILCCVYCLCLWQISSNHLDWKDSKGDGVVQPPAQKLGEHWPYTSLLRALSTPSGMRFFWAPVPILNYTQGSVSSISSADSLILLLHWRAWLCSL